MRKVRTLEDLSMDRQLDGEDDSSALTGRSESPPSTYASPPSLPSSPPLLPAMPPLAPAATVRPRRRRRTSSHHDDDSDGESSSSSASLPRFSRLSLGVGPVNANITKIRKHLGTLRRRYISIWQLVLVAVLLQGVLHYGNLMLGEPGLGDLLSERAALGQPVSALFVLVREFSPLAMVLIALLIIKWQRTLRLMDALFEGTYTLEARAA